MADELTCTAEAIHKYLVDNGGKVSNQDLVKHFKKFLSGPNSLPNARSAFKDFVNTVASIKVEDGVKFVVLKKRGYDEKSESDTSSSREDDTKNDSKKCKFSEKNKEILHSHSSPSIFDMAPQPVDGSSQQATSPILWSSDLPPGHVPQPPPRRRYSMKGKENRGSKYEESIRQIYGEKESVTSPRDDEIREVVSPGSVREKAHLLNKMANETDVPLRQSYNPGRRREHRDEKAGDEDTCSISSMDPRRKEWIIKSAHSDYHELVRLLREEPKLAFVKDHNKTALHWAAKRGSLDVIKLMAGTYKLDSNAKTGYSPLHLAAISGHEEIMEVLINTYGADPSVRDYSGKRALHYLPRNQAERFLMMFPNLAFPIQLCGKVVTGGAGGGKLEKEHSSSGLIRMGSLNSKVKKPSVLSASGRAITRMKSWGSADNIPDRAMNLMPPPKTFPKKKKARKYTDIIGISETWRGRSPDSDSDSASGFAS